MTTLTGPDGQGTLLLDTDPAGPAGNRDRFTARWRLTGAGLCNVWRYGDLNLDAPSGRLLMRGANGTGKTTALEALCPYLLDLNPARLAAGKARPTTLASLMREGADGKRRTGYAWLTFAAPRDEEHPHAEQSWGVRLQYGPSSSPQVKVVPFTVPGRPLTDLALHGPAREALRTEEFTAAVEQAGGTVFPSPEEYVTHLALHLWQGTADDVDRLTGRLRAVRNPSLLGDVSPGAAAEALRASLPTVDPAVVQATAEALAASDETRDAFDRDRAAADVLADFASVWTGHVTDVLTRQHQAALTAQQQLAEAVEETSKRAAEHQTAVTALAEAEEKIGSTQTAVRRAEGQVQALKESDAYQGALQLDQLGATLTAQNDIARTQAEHLVARAKEVNRTGAQLRARLDDEAGELEDVTEQAGQAAPAALPEAPLLAWRDTPRAVLQVGERLADPGPGLNLSTHADLVSATAAAWQDLGREHRVAGERAGLLLGEHQRAVVPAEKAAGRAAEVADRARQRHEEASQRLHQRTSAAQQTQSALVDAVTAWAAQHPDLVTADPLPEEGQSADEGLPSWDDEQADSLRLWEPAQALPQLDRFAEQVTAHAGLRAGAARSAAELAENEAAARRREAAGWRSEAAELRSGALLPLPRPHWSGAADDAAALGSVLTWRDDQNSLLQAALEVALADSGLLSAHLAVDGAATGTWQVSTAADVVHPNLTQYLSVDPTHPLAAAAGQVLLRVHVARTAPASASGLVVGEDGSFTVGPLRGDRLADGTGQGRAAAPSASFVGERQRRAAAVARAAALEAEAATLEDQATELSEQARRLREEATQVSSAARAVPSRDPLRKAEALRASAAQECATAERAASESATAAQTAREAIQAAHDAWAAHARSLGLQADVEELAQVQRGSQQAAQTLGRCAATLTRLGSRIATLGRDVEHNTANAAELPALRDQALASLGQATETEARIQQLLAVAGADIHTICDELTAAQAAHDGLTRERDELVQRKTEFDRAEAGLGVQLGKAQERQAERTPAAASAVARLRELLALPGVVPALVSPAASHQPEEDPPSGEGTGDPTAAAEPGELLEQTARLLAGHRSVGRRALQERYDTARSQLAGVWTLDHGEPCRDLDTFVLTHDDEMYTPAGAAAHAAELATAAEEALRAKDDAALRSFIIGRLPNAIALAWVRLHDWKREVNTKMKAASASSGVGVQVDISPEREMPAAVRTVYELAGKTGATDRGPEEQERLAAAIRSLIDAAEGETMVERVATAVDVRDWVTVTYQVTRPGQDARAWTSRTGLSGGERRLVVLAPMLAAVAAGYDALHTTGLRLVTLDEVPAEVDEAGREGLARYLAELDLDLVCTSYLWDGAPGAWDGIDAWDFEGDDSGTVVAFPMRVRGLLDLPDDDFAGPGAEGSDG